MPSTRALALLLTLALACSGTVGTPTGTPAPGRLLRPRPPVNVSYNHRGLLIDGSPTLWIAGSMHYARFTPGLWPNALRLAKEVGMNGVTSYVMWNLHEPRRGS